MNNTGSSGRHPGSHDLDAQGISGLKHIYWNLTPEELYEHSVSRNEGMIAHLGALSVNTGQHTGRSPNDKFVVKESSSEQNVWWGDVNRPFEQAKFDRLQKKVFEYLKGKEVYVRDCYAGADAEFRIPIRVINEYA